MSQKTLQAAYESCFSQENGKMILRHLLDSFGFFHSPPVQDPWQSGYIAGQRHVLAVLLSNAGVTEKLLDQIGPVVEEATREEEG